MSDKLDLRIDSDPANIAGVRKSIEHFCEKAGMEEPARHDVGLVVNEALANVIRHAYKGMTDKPIEISARRHEGGVRIRIRDWGCGINPTLEPRPPKDPLMPGGVGLICMRKLMDEVTYTPQPDGMLLEMTRLGAAKSKRCG